MRRRRRQKVKMDRCLLKAGLCFGEHLCVRAGCQRCRSSSFFIRDSRVNASKDRNRMHLEPYYCRKKKKKREENVFNRTGGVRLNFPPYFLFSFFFPREIHPYIFNFTDIETKNEYRRLTTPKEERKRGKKRRKKIGNKCNEK